MNQQIKDLAKQSGIYFDGFGAAIATYGNDELQKFAELIIKECVNYVKDLEFPYVAEDIADHFGIEE
jgi:hypothetical protein